MIGNDLCGGAVSHSCPFTEGSGLNNKYYGDFIYNIQLDYTDWVGSDSSGNAEATSDQGGTGTIFIYDQTDNVDYLVNRYWSDYNYENGIGGSNPQAGLTANGNGDQANADGNIGIANTSQWLEKT